MFLEYKFNIPKYSLKSAENRRKLCETHKQYKYAKI